MNQRTSSLLHTLNGLMSECYGVLRKAITKADTKRVVLLLSLLFSAVLLATCTYVTYEASREQITNGDQFNTTYAVSDYSFGDHLNVIKNHTNLLKLPLLWVISHMHYDKIAYVAMNLILVFSTFITLSLLIFKITKSRGAFIASTCIFSGLLLASPDLAINFSMPTIRNIEYPLFLLFLWTLTRLNGQNALLNDAWRLILLGLLIASDFWFVYVAIPALLISIILLYIKGKVDKLQAFRYACVIFGGLFLGETLLILLGSLHFFSYHDNLSFFVAANNLPGNLYNTFVQLIQLFGGNFFGSTIGVGGIISFCLASITLMWIYASQVLAKISIEKTVNDRNSIIYTTSFFITLFSVALYVLAGYATADTANIRYLSSIPVFATLSTICWLTIRGHHKVLLGVSIVVLILGCAKMMPNHRTYAWMTGIINETRRTPIQAVINVATKENIPVVIGSFTYSSQIRFLSGNNIKAYNIVSCNNKDIPYSNSGWYVTSATIHKSALVVDRGFEDPFEGWTNCSDNKLKQLYGEPSKIISVGSRNGKPIRLWVFNYDIRTKLQ